MEEKEIKSAKPLSDSQRFQAYSETVAQDGNMNDGGRNAKKRFVGKFVYRKSWHFLRRCRHSDHSIPALNQRDPTYPIDNSLRVSIYYEWEACRAGKGPDLVSRRDLSGMPRGYLLTHICRQTLKLHQYCIYARHHPHEHTDLRHVYEVLNVEEKRNCFPWFNNQVAAETVQCSAVVPTNRSFVSAGLPSLLVLDRSRSMASRSYSCARKRVKGCALRMQDNSLSQSELRITRMLRLCADRH